MILIACGLRAEARWLARDGVVAIAGGGDATRLEAELDALAPQADAILSMGIAGGLAPLLGAGDWVVGTIAPSGGQRREWSVGAGAGRGGRAEIASAASPGQQSERNRAWIARVARLLPGAVVGRIHGENRIVATAAEKHMLHRETRAIACDMESHVAARVAARHGLPFAVARTVCDPASRTLPLAARVAMAPDGRIAFGRLTLALVARVWEIPRLIAVARDMGRARRALRRGYDALARAGFGLADARQLTFEMR